MGKLILCSGNRTDRPYVFASTGTRIYSIEELCYYIGENIYLLDEEMFSDSLIDWIDRELGLGEPADKLRQTKIGKSDLKTKVTIVLCSADYFTEKEVKDILYSIDKISLMNPIKRNCLKAINYLKKHQYIEANAEYVRILNSKDAINMTPEDYGDILHNMAVASIYTSGLTEATELFRQSYERNHKELTLKQYLSAILMSGDQELYDEKVIEYQVDPALYQDTLNEMDNLLTEAKNSANMEQIQQLKQDRTQGKQTEFIQKTEELLYTWISRYKRGINDEYQETVL